ncbi:MAG: hypothetical protein ACO34E_11780 [Limisphaerales bacterium]|jgi:hypothetical protein
MSNWQKALVFVFAFGCLIGCSSTLWLATQNRRLEMELDTFVRLAARAKASDAVGRGAPYLLRLTSDGLATGSSIVATNNGIPVRLYPRLSARDVMFVHVFNEKTTELLGSDAIGVDPRKHYHGWPIYPEVELP